MVQGQCHFYIEHLASFSPSFRLQRQTELLGTRLRLPCFSVMSSVEI